MAVPIADSYRWNRELAAALGLPDAFERHP